MGLLFNLGCQSGSSSSSSSNWDIGSEGIVFDYVTSKPPSSIRRDSNTLSVIVDYSNKGTYSPNSLIFFLSGYDPSYLFGQSVISKSSQKLEAKTQYTPQGSQIFSAQWESGINRPEGKGPIPQTLFLTACYDYKTTAEVSICINPGSDEYDKTQTRKCEYSVKGLNGDQGAPLAITAIRQSAENNNLYVEVEVSNKGKGISFLTNVNDCLSISRNDKDVFSARVSVSGQELECEPQKSSGKIRMQSNKAILSCKKQISFAPYTTTLLKVELNYNYIDNKIKEIMIDR
jgi:hypothetical protein